MFDKFVSWSNFILSPVVAGVFSYYIYIGQDATLSVWLFAYLGILHTFLSGVRGIIRN